MLEPFVGEIRMFAGNFAPRGWALCDGQLLAISQNDALFSLLGIIYGGDGRTTFGLPDMRSRIPVHAGAGPGLSSRSQGANAGVENATITNTQLPLHSHQISASGSNAEDTLATDKVLASVTGGDLYRATGSLQSLNNQSISNTGGSRSHTNLMPYLCVHYIVALFGIFPSRN